MGGLLGICAAGGLSAAWLRAVGVTTVTTGRAMMGRSDDDPAARCLRETDAAMWSHQRSHGRGHRRRIERKCREGDDHDVIAERPATVTCLPAVHDLDLPERVSRDGHMLVNAAGSSCTVVSVCGDEPAGRLSYDTDLPGEREPGGNPGLSRSGERERPPSQSTGFVLGSDGVVQLGVRSRADRTRSMPVSPKTCRLRRVRRARRPSPRGSGVTPISTHSGEFLDA